MSGAIFHYFIHADLDRKTDLTVDIPDTLQEHWKEQEASGTVKKFDDLGDALLHALDELLCGTSNYRPLIPASPALHLNRSVVLAVRPDHIYWVVLQCTWNAFTVENMGVSASPLYRYQKYSDKVTAEFIKDNLPPPIRAVLTQFNVSQSDCSDMYAEVEHIKVIVKQLTGYKWLGITSKAAGSLTAKTVEAMTLVYDEEFARNSRLSRVHDKDGWTYIRTLLPSEKKLQVQRSTGKHTNAIISFLGWAKIHLPVFVKNRPLCLDSQEKQKVFQALVDIASEGSSHQMEMLRLSPHVVTMLQANPFCDTESQRMLADLLLIGLNKNGKYVSALSHSYRQSSSKKGT